MKSPPRTMFVTAGGKAVSITFVHTDNYTVIAEITADNTPGLIRAIRNSEDSWVVLDDTLDRVKLFNGGVPPRLPIDLERTYQDYLQENFVT